MGLGVDEGRKRVIGDHGSDPSRPQEDRSISTGEMGEDQSGEEIREVKKEIADETLYPLFGCCAGI